MTKKLTFFFLSLILFFPEFRPIFCSPFSEKERREIISNAIKKDGYIGPITIKRNDSVKYPFFSYNPIPLLYYEVFEGGITKEKNKELQYVLPAHPMVWRIFVNQETNKVFRVFGFKSGNDFSSLAQ